MSERLISDRVIELPCGAQRGDKPIVRVQLTATRLIVSPFNPDADDILDGELVLPVDQIRELFSA